MALEIVTNFFTLMSLAYKMGQAEKNGDQKEFEIAKIKHDEYKELCLKSNRMTY